MSRPVRRNANASTSGLSVHGVTLLCLTVLQLGAVPSVVLLRSGAARALLVRRSVAFMAPLARRSVGYRCRAARAPAPLLRPRFGAARTRRVGRIRAQLWPSSRQFWKMSVNVGPNLVELRPNLAEPESIWARFRNLSLKCSCFLIPAFFVSDSLQVVGAAHAMRRATSRRSERHLGEAVWHERRVPAPQAKDAAAAFAKAAVNARVAVMKAPSDVAAYCVLAWRVQRRLLPPRGRARGSVSCSVSGVLVLVGNAHDLLS